MGWIRNLAKVFDVHILQVRGRGQNHETFKYVVRRVKFEGGEITQPGRIGSDLVVAGEKVPQGSSTCWCIVVWFSFIVLLALAPYLSQGRPIYCSMLGYTATCAMYLYGMNL